MKRDDEAFRMSDSGLEAAATDRRPGRARSAGSGFQDKKKVVIVVVLAVVGLGIVAYQFLGGGSPKEAAAITTLGGAVPAAGLPDIEATLKGFDSARTSGTKDFTVAQVEDLVKKFDGYVAERQVPLKDLRANPFAVAVDTKAQAEAAAAQAQPGTPASAPDPAAEARAKSQRVGDAASRLILGSVLVAGSNRLAMINGNFCRVGDVVEGFQVTAIEPDKVRVTSEDVAVDVRLPMSAKSGIKGSPNAR